MSASLVKLNRYVKYSPKRKFLLTQVIPEEVEQVFSNQPRVKRMNKGHYRGEDVYRALGQTEAGRYLAVFFIQS